jgi:hypothetical protein
MLVKEATEIVGGVGETSKMPGKTYGLPVAECGVGGRLRTVTGSTCASCYAYKGMYVTHAKTVKAAQYRRLDSLTHPRWVDAMVTLVSRLRVPYFRWHDSGDLQSVDHLRRIVQVAERTPDIHHWVPTREYRIVGLYRKLYGDFPLNLVVRLSAHMVEADAPTTDLPTSTVTAKAFTCPASLQDNECRKCRKCWDPNVANVAYAIH